MKNDWFCNTVMLLLPKSLRTTQNENETLNKQRKECLTKASTETSSETSTDRPFLHGAGYK